MALMSGVSLGLDRVLELGGVLGVALLAPVALAGHVDHVHPQVELVQGFELAQAGSLIELWTGPKVRVRVP